MPLIMVIIITVDLAPVFLGSFNRIQIRRRYGKDNVGVVVKTTILPNF